MKKSFIAMALAAVLSIGFVAGAFAAEGMMGSPDAKIRFKVGVTTAPDGHYVGGLLKMQKLLEEYTNGELTMDVYHSSMLGNESDMLDNISMGMQEMGLISTGPIPMLAKSLANWKVLDLPYIFTSREHAEKVLDGPVGELLLKGFDGTGIKGISFWSNGFRQLSNNKVAVTHPADMKGIKVRTMENATHMATYRALGATPTAMAMSEVFPALQQGTIDGQENPLVIIHTARIYEVQKYVTVHNLFYSPCVLVINEDIYNGLTDAQRDAFNRAAKEAQKFERDLTVELDARGRKIMEEAGVQVIDVEQGEWVEATKSVYEDASLNIDQDLLAKVIAAGK